MECYPALLEGPLEGLEGRGLVEEGFQDYGTSEDQDGEQGG